MFIMDKAGTVISRVRTVDLRHRIWLILERLPSSTNFDLTTDPPTMAQKSVECKIDRHRWTVCHPMGGFRKLWRITCRKRIWGEVQFSVIISKWAKTSSPTSEPSLQSSKQDMSRRSWLTSCPNPKNLQENWININQSDLQKCWI